MTVKDTDKGLKKFLKEIANLKKKEAVVGVYGSYSDEPKKDSNVPGITVLDVAKAHEFGISTNDQFNLPQRSFLGQAADKDGVKAGKFLERKFKGVVDGKIDSDIMLGLGGEFMRKSVLEQFRVEGDPKWAPLSPTTINIRSKKIPGGAKKPGDIKILVDTGQLRQSIHSQVRDK
jgi:phage gpG-like protein